MFHIKEEQMQRVCLARPLAAGVFVVALATFLGCPSPREKTEQPQTQSPASASESTTEVEPSVTSKPPVAEFQHPSAVPMNEPLPQPAMEGTKPRSVVAPPVAPPVAPLIATTDRGFMADDEPRNPLRDVEKPPADRPKTSKNSGIPFDPVKENGSIFDGWQKPKVALVITGMESGYLEPCGCAGLDRMKGGMSRRATFIKQLRDDGWPVLALDVGGLVHGFGRQAELKYQTAVEGKRKAGYNAIAFGTDDLRLPAGELVAVAADVDGKPSPFVAANVGLLGHPGDITAQSRILEAGGMKIGVTAILGREFQKEIHNDEIELLDPEVVLAKIVPELKKKSDYLVLLAHATKDESEELGKKFPDFNVVVTSAVPPEEPPKDFETIPGMKTLLITVGYKGMNAIVLGLFDNKEEPWRYERVPLDSRFTASPEMKLLMAAYQEQLKAIGFAGLGLRAVPHPQAESNGGFIGSKKCGTCHEKSYDIWKKTGHAKAYKTLEELNPPRNFDPECVSCHVIGWHPTKYFPYVGGYESKEKTPASIDVGCENCHGPGEKHAKAEEGGDTVLQEKLRKTVAITKDESKKQQCYSCHDLDNSPDFDFDKYWPFVEHKEQ